MRFVYGLFLGSFGMTVLATTVGNAWFKPGVESYPEYHDIRRDCQRVTQEKFHAELERDRANRRASELELKLQLDVLRRGLPNPVNPAGLEVPKEDLIPAPAMPLPVVPPAQPQTDEEGEEVVMAGPATKSTAIAKSPGATLALNSVAELQQLAEILYRGGLTPPGIDNPNKVAAVILAGLEVGLAPTQALGSIMLTNGRLSIYGDGAMALVRASGLLENIEEWVDGDGEDRTGHCKAKRKGEPERHYKFTMREATQAGLIERARGKDGKGRGPWVSYPDRMLVARPRGFLFRDVFPDVLRGLITYEEAQDLGHDTSNVVNTEVRVVGATADIPGRATGEFDAPPATQGTTFPTFPTLQPAAVMTNAAEEPPATEQPGPVPITTAQKDEFVRLYGLVMASKGLKEKPAQKAAWEQILAPYGVASINQMDSATAARAIADILRAYDPFTQPSSAPSQS